MDDAKVGRLVRVIRQRRGWRQVDLARKAGVGASVVSYVESGQLAGRTIATVRAIAGALGLSIECLVRGPGADLHRVLDARHSALLGACATWLEDLGWTTSPEVTFSEFGERGSVDLLAWHASTRTLLIVEIKTELVSVEETLRRHGVKMRLGTQIARPLGWSPSVVSRLLVLPEDRTQRRRVLANEPVMRSAYPARSSAVKAWCRQPVGKMSGLIFLPNSTPTGRMVDGARRERVGRPRPTDRGDPAVEPDFAAISHRVRP